MNYYELFNLPLSFQPDKTALKKKFIELSRKYHPDFHTQSNSKQQEEMLEMSAMLNEAFQTLSNTDNTIQYLLKLKGSLKEDEKYNLPQDFLLEMMDLNETLMEAEDKEQVEKIIKDKKNKLEEAIAPILTQSLEGENTKNNLNFVKEYYFKKKYLDRILETKN